MVCTISRRASRSRDKLSLFWHLFDCRHFYYLCVILISILGIDFHLHTIYNSMKYSCFTEIDIDPPPSQSKCL